MIPLALSAARTFHNIIKDLQDPSPELQALTSQVSMIHETLVNIRQSLEGNHDPNMSILAGRSKQLGDAITKGSAILGDIQRELKIARSRPLSAVPEGTAVSAGVIGERLKSVWNNDRIGRWSSALSQYSSTLSLLLQS